MEPDRYATVLVALVNNRRDLEIAREQHWYRLPVRHAPPRAVSAPVLAFYQTAAFGAEKWAVNYWAEATAWDVVTRRQLLPDQPNHPRASQKYYRLALGELQRLPHPIPSRRWRRITFIVTHWERLQEAAEINDLLHGTIWEERLWAAFRKAGILAERRYEMEEQRAPYTVDFAIFCRQGPVGVTCQEPGGATAHGLPEGVLSDPSGLSRSGRSLGWLLLHFSEQQIEQSPADCLAAVQRAIQERGGLDNGS